MCKASVFRFVFCSSYLTQRVIQIGNKAYTSFSNHIATIVVKDKAGERETKQTFCCDSVYIMLAQQQQSIDSCQLYAHCTYFISFSLLGNVAIHSGIFHICILAHASEPVMGLFLHIKLFPNVSLCAVMVMFDIIYHLDLARVYAWRFFQSSHFTRQN